MLQNVIIIFNASLVSGSVLKQSPTIQERTETWYNIAYFEWICGASLLIRCCLRDRVSSQLFLYIVVRTNLMLFYSNLCSAKSPSSTAQRYFFSFLVFNALSECSSYNKPVKIFVAGRKVLLDLCRCLCCVSRPHCLELRKNYSYHQSFGGPREIYGLLIGTIIILRLPSRPFCYHWAWECEKGTNKYIGNKNWFSIKKLLCNNYH